MHHHLSAGPQFTITSHSLTIHFLKYVLNSLWTKLRIAHAPCSTEIIMAAHEAKLHGPYYGSLKPSSIPKQRHWKLEYVKTCLCKILGTSSPDLRVFASTLRGKWSKMVQKSSEDSQKDLRLTECTRSYPLHLQHLI